MIRLAATTLLAALLLAAPAAQSDAKTLGRGYVVDEDPLRVIAIASAYKPSRLALDVVAEPVAPVRVEWSVLCFRSPGPTTHGDAIAERPLHRRVELPPRPRRVCHFEAEAAFVEPEQQGRIDVTLRGHVKKPPVDLPG